MVESGGKDHVEALETLERYLTFRIARAARLLDRFTTQCLAGSGLNLTAYRVLLVLDIFGETTAANMGRLMVIDRAQISRTVAELVGAGLILTRPDPSSGRSRLLSLSEDGRARIGGIRPTVDEGQADVLQVLSVEERRALSSHLDALTAILATRLGEPEALPSGAVRPGEAVIADPAT
ncbi:MAG: MarR family transcriptional regulator [Pseudomonadota bacterium]